MASLGIYNEVEILRESTIGFYVDGGDWGEVLYPNKYILEGMEVGDVITVLLYLDSEGRPVATNEKAFGTVGDFVFLRVTHTNDFGAFMDWGVNKELFVPFGEQATKMIAQQSHIVYIYEDILSNRLAASSKINKFFDDVDDVDDIQFTSKSEVNILVWKQTDLGFKVVINNSLEGMVYQNEIYSNLKIGDTRVAYIKKIREDKKIDVSLTKIGHSKIDEFAKIVFLKLNLSGGYLKINDKSSPQEILKLFEMSKKNFKKAIGQLYKERKIIIKVDGIYLID